MAIRILHTSDWHLGKRLFRIDRLPEQRQFLTWLLDCIRTQSIDALVVAGDIFDTPLPNVAALQLYFRFLKELTDYGRCHVFIIAGNHDSGRFLEAPIPLLESSIIHIVGDLHSDPSQHAIAFADRDDPSHSVGFLLLPYFRTSDIASGVSLLEAGDDDESDALILAGIRQQIETWRMHLPSVSHRILVTHHAVGSYAATGTEQVLSLSGVTSIPPSTFEGLCDEVLLGHIHRPQCIRSESPRIHYSGSPISLRFSETDPRLVRLLTLTRGGIQNESIPVPAFRPLHVIRATEETLSEAMTNLRRQLEQTQTPELLPLVDVQLELRAPVNGIADTIRTALPPTLCELISISTQFSGSDTSSTLASLAPTEAHAPSTEELFDAFFLERFPASEGPSISLRRDFLELLSRARSVNPDESEGSES